MSASSIMSSFIVLVFALLVAAVDASTGGGESSELLGVQKHPAENRRSSSQSEQSRLCQFRSVSVAFHCRTHCRTDSQHAAASLSQKVCVFPRRLTDQETHKPQSLAETGHKVFYSKHTEEAQRVTAIRKLCSWSTSRGQGSEQILVK